jgi:hypothetical protein
MSFVPPGVCGTTRVIGRIGYLSTGTGAGGGEPDCEPDCELDCELFGAAGCVGAVV